MTLEDLWKTRGEITQVAIRAGAPGKYLSVAHPNYAAAITAADNQVFTAEDLLTDDWELSDAP